MYIFRDKTKIGFLRCYMEIVRVYIYMHAFIFRWRVTLISWCMKTMRTQMKVAVIVTPGILGFCITAIISAFVFHDRHHRSKGICWECWATGLCKNVYMVLHWWLWWVFVYRNLMKVFFDATEVLRGQYKSLWIMLLLLQILLFLKII